MKLALLTSLPVLLGTALTSGAQAPAAPTLPTEPPLSAPDDATVRLSPFEVTTTEDRGYQAVNSLAGGRTNTPLRLTPSALSALTRAFIDDLALTDLRQSLAWTINVAPGNLRQNETPFGDYQYNFRGTGSTGNYPTRNYFLYYGVGDTYNTERFEFARGPNSILFGDAQLGGVATTFTKVPRLNDRRAVTALQYDSYGAGRATLDANQPLGDRSALRLNALVQRGRSWRDGTDQDHDAGTLALLHHFTDRTQVRLEGEWGRVERQIYSTNYFDQASFWDGAATYDGTGPIADPQAVGLAAFNPNQPEFVWIPALAAQGGGYGNWSGFYRTTGTGVALQTRPRSDVPNTPALPSREFNLGPPDSEAAIRYRSLTGWLDHRLTDQLQAQLSFYDFHDRREARNTELFNSYAIDVNRVLPNGQPNPKFGVPFAESSPSRQWQKRSVREFRAALTYSFDVDAADLTQRFSVLAGTRRETFEVATHNLRRTGGPDQNPALNAPENLVRYRLYWDEPRRYRLSDIPTAEGYTFGYVPNGWFNWERKNLDYAQIAANTTLWDERVSIVLGARYDDVNRRQRNPIYSDGPTELGPVTEDGAHALTYSAGAVVYPLPWLGVFCNYSENFAPVTPGPNQLDGSAFGPTRGEGMDYGIKLNLAGGMVYATLSRYESRQTGRITSDPKIGIVRAIWRHYGATDPNLTTIDYRDTESLEASGYEFEIVANPTPNLRLSAGYARPETETVDLLPGLRAYEAQHRAEWQAALDNGTAVNPTGLEAELNNLRQSLENAAAGTVLNGTMKYTANVYATYQFLDGPLDGFSLGAGVWARGRQKVGSADPRILFDTEEPTDEQRQDAAFSYLYAPAHYSLSAHLAYEWRVNARMRAKLQLNVDNLLDEDDPVYLAYNTYRPGGLPANPLVQTRGFFNYPDPRRFTLTATLSF